MERGCTGVSHAIKHLALLHPPRRHDVQSALDASAAVRTVGPTLAFRHACSRRTWEPGYAERNGCSALGRPRVPNDMQRAIDLFLQNMPMFIDRSAERVFAARLPAYAGLSLEALRDLIGNAYKAAATDLIQGTVEVYPAYFRMRGPALARRQVDVAEINRAVGWGFDVVTEYLEEAFSEDLAMQLWWQKRSACLNYVAAQATIEAFFKAREDIIAEQRAEIERLSAPILPVVAGVLVLPLVGAIHPARAEAILEALLARVSRDQAAVVILDITGILNVDAAAVAVFVRAAQACRLLGARVLLVGIRPELAQAIVGLGLDLREITTFATLEGGVLYALRLLGKSIVAAPTPR